MDDELRIDRAQFQKSPRPQLIIEMPRVVSGEAAMLAFNLMRQLANAFYRKYGEQIQRAEAQRNRAIDKLRRDKDAMTVELERRAAQLDFDLENINGNEFDNGDDDDDHDHYDDGE